MNQGEAASQDELDPTPRHGVNKERIEQLLAEAEPRRKQALAASVALIVATGVAVFQSRLFGNTIIMPLLVTLVLALGIWPLCNRLWRGLAIGTLAPAIGERWGQSEFASSLAAMDWSQFFADFFSSGGTRIVAWRSAGRYRDIPYRLKEVTIRERSNNGSKRRVRHFLVAEIALSPGLAGSVRLRPKTGAIGKIGEFVDQISGRDERRISIDPHFDAVFDTIASANVPVDQLLTPDFRRTLQSFAAHHPETRFTAEAEHGWFKLHLPIRTLALASANLRNPMPEMAEEADVLWWELTIPHRLIDGLKGDHDGPLR